MINILFLYKIINRNVDRLWLYKIINLLCLSYLLIYALYYLSKCYYKAALLNRSNPENTTPTNITDGMERIGT